MSKRYVGAAMALFSLQFAADPAPSGLAAGAADPRRRELYEAWHRLPVPPITPYSGPFGGEARAFVGKLDPNSEVARHYADWQRLGTYDPERDPRRINHEFEKAVLEDWTRMGYNAAYKGQRWTYRSGRWLKKQGLLGAIDQTVWAARGAPALGYDGKPGPTYQESCGSFFAKSSYDAGVAALANLATHHGRLDLVQVGGYSITCSWDEVGMRTRSMIDCQPEAVVEYRRYLEHVWFRDASPGQDTNADGRTYNQFAGEKLTTWDQVQPPLLSPKYYEAPKPIDEKWRRPGAYKLWVDFHRYFTFEFFRRVNEAASARCGQKIECYPFPQAFIVWPGANCFWGMSNYWNTRLNPIINVEQCWPDSPAMTLNYAQTDRLARKFSNVVMGWSWFYFGQQAEDMYDGPGDVERALARMMGHRVDGIHHWLYSPQYRGLQRPQRLQLAYWHNFLGKHYATFLSRSAPPVPQVALLAPDYTGYFYRMFAYPKMDYAYTAAALVEAQIPFEIVSEEEIELDADALTPYRVLYVVGSEWTTPTIRRRIRRFISGGGHVFANADSLSLDIPTGQRTDFLERTFGVKLSHKHKNPFCPSAQTASEEAWAAELTGWGKPLSFQGHHLHRPGTLSALWQRKGGKVVRNEEQWRKIAAVMSRMPRTGRGGIAQTPIDMRTAPKITYAGHVGPPAGLATYGEINTADVVEGQAIAWYGDKVCGVERARTVWLGPRPGMSLHALAPRISLSRPTEPGNPFPAQVSDQYVTHKPYVDLVAYAARRAGVKPLVMLTLDGEIPCNIEVLPRLDEKGNMMVIVINHDSTDATYEVSIEPAYIKEKLPTGSTAWNLLKAELIEERTDGRFPLAVPPYRVTVIFVGSAHALGPVRDAQAKLAAMDLSVPRYFLDRPELNVQLWDTPIPADRFAAPTYR